MEQYDFFNRFLNDSLKIKGKLISSLRKDITESDSEAIKKLKTFFQMCEKGGNVLLLFNNNVIYIKMTFTRILHYLDTNNIQILTRQKN